MGHWINPIGSAEMFSAVYSSWLILLQWFTLQSMDIPPEIQTKSLGELLEMESSVET